MTEKSNKELLILKLKQTIKILETKGDELDVSCMVIGQKKGVYEVDIYEFL